MNCCVNNMLKTRELEILTLASYFKGPPHCLGTSRSPNDSFLDLIVAFVLKLLKTLELGFNVAW